MLPSVLGSKSMSHVWLAAQVAVAGAGALFHLLCEVSGVNDWLVLPE